MTRSSRAWTRWGLVVLFAIGMAWVEAATVYYLRVLVDRVNPYHANPLPMWGTLGHVELVREAATLVMLAAVGLLAGRTRAAQLGYTAIAFGVWDIFYYVFLRLISDWPRSLFDWDILFLLPLPWWGPVLAPVCIAVLMIVGGTVASRSTVVRPATRRTRTMRGLCGLGTALALYVFMADSLAAVRHGLVVTTTVLPTAFNWPLFGVAVALMALPLVPGGSRPAAAPQGPPAEGSPSAAVQEIAGLGPLTN
jgi:hypothetical protein